MSCHVPVSLMLSTTIASTVDNGHPLPVQQNQTTETRGHVACRGVYEMQGNTMTRRHTQSMQALQSIRSTLIGSPAQFDVSVHATVVLRQQERAVRSLASRHVFTRSGCVAAEGGMKRSKQTYCRQHSLFAILQSNWTAVCQQARHATGTCTTDTFGRGGLAF